MSEKKIRFNFIRMAALPCLFVFVLCARPAFLGAGTNLDEKAKYEKVLEQKVEELLVSLLGPGKAKVMVQATIDFSATENLTSAGIEQPAPGSAPGGSGPGGANAPWWSEIMDKIQTNSAGTGTGANVRKATVFPQTMIKSLNVSLVLSDTLSEQEVQKVRAVTGEMLGMDPGRGDKMQIMSAKFAPLWYTNEMFNTLVKYGVLAAILIVAMGIVAVGFLKMAAAMNGMTGSSQQKISMEMNTGGGVGDQAMNLGLPESGFSVRGTIPAVEQEQGDGGASEEVVFNIPPGKLNILVSMMKTQEAADIAMIAVHLPAALRSQFISRFPPEKVSDICASIATVRFVAPEMIARIKEELERRLSGAVGGDDKLLEVIGSVDLKTKKTLFEDLRKNHPEVAARVRPEIIFIEDIEKLSEKDFDVLIGTISVEQWALAAWELRESARARLKEHMAAGAWKIVEQTMKYGRPPEGKIEKAAETVIASLLTLISEAKISNPNSAGPGPVNGSQAEIAFKPAPVGASKAAVPGNAAEGEK